MFLAVCDVKNDQGVIGSLNVTVKCLAALEAVEKEMQIEGTYWVCETVKVNLDREYGRNLSRVQNEKKKMETIWINFADSSCVVYDGSY